MENDFSLFRGRRVLVTGSTGFKGSWLCHWLLKLGADVSGFALPPEPHATLFDRLRLNERIRQYDGDIRDLGTVTQVLAKSRPEVIIHLAAQALVRRSYQDPKATFDINVGGGVNLLEAVRTCGGDLRALVFITSDKCYRNKEWLWGYRENDELGGADPYSASKAAVELAFTAYQESFLAARSDLAAATTRAGNVIGGGDFSPDRIVPDCVRALSSGRDIVLRNPQSTRPWQHVLEPLSGYLALAAGMLKGCSGMAGAWNFGPEAENVRPVQELAELACDAWGGGRIDIQCDPNAPHEANLLMLSSDKAKTKLGWRPRWDFSTAVRRTVGWYRAVHNGADAVAVTDADIAAYEEAER